MSQGKSIRLFLADGSPGGVVTAEIMNWTGHVVAVPRSELSELLKREESSRTGIYILIGDDPTSIGGLSAYIGESDDVGQRLKQHNRPESNGGKDFWERAIILTSKDMNLTKAHARYLESRLITIAQAAERATVLNGTAPPTPNLPEADVSDMEYYVSQAQIVLPVLGVNVLRGATAPAVDDAFATGGAKVNESPTFVMVLKKDGIQAAAKEIDSEFIVLAGSQARGAWVGINTGYTALHRQLIDEGTLAVDASGIATFTRNRAFSSPSAAAAIISGRNSNGRLDWKLKGTRRTLADWQEQQVQSAPTQDGAG